jgi:hypothetical protein
MSGRGVILGGPNARFRRVHGDIVASYQYVNDERAMVLWPLHRKGVPAFIVCDSAAFKYDDPKYLAAQALKCAEMWGMESSSTVWFRVATIIHEGLSDLIRLPPLPAGKVSGPVIGEASLRMNGVEIGGTEVRMPTLDELARFEGPPQ